MDLMGVLACDCSKTRASTRMHRQNCGTEWSDDGISETLCGAEAALRTCQRRSDRPTSTSHDLPAHHKLKL